MMRNNILALWGMARPMLLPIGLSIYVIGALIANAADFELSLAAFLWGLVALAFSLLSAHYTNEYADFETDALTQGTPFSGGSGVLARGIGSRKMALAAGWITMLTGLAVALAGVLLDQLSVAALFLWIIGTAISWAYSLPPFKLAWRGFAEVINGLIVGVLLPLYGYTVQTGRIDWEVIVGCAPFALLIFALILTTNWADREADSQAGKMTLTTRLEAPQLRGVYISAIFGAFLIQPLLALDDILPELVVLSSLPALPLLGWAATKYTRIHSPIPTVAAMLSLIPLQFSAWALVGIGNLLGRF